MAIEFAAGKTEMKKPLLDVRLVGTKSEIEGLLSILNQAGVEWKTSGHFYPRIGELDRFSYYLDGVKTATPYLPLQQSN